MMDKRIAIFVPTLQFGGAERVALNLASGFLQRGFSVDILVASDRGVFGDLIPVGARLYSLGNKGRVLRALPNLVNYLRRESPWCVVPIMDHTNVVTLWARWLARMSTTILATTHCLPSVEARHGYRLREKLSPYAVRSFLRFADGIVAASSGIANDLARTGKIARERITVIHNPVLTPEFYSKLAEPVSDFYLRYPNRPVIISVGRLVASKDFPTLIRAFAEVKKEVSSRLLILGEGEQRPALERLIAELRLVDDVLLAGYTPNPYAHMARAKLFVLSSAYEAFGNVLIESLAAGTPVVATDCPGPREILQDGRFGDLVTVGETEALAKAMVKVLRSGGTIPPSDYLKQFQLEPVIDAYVCAIEAAARHSSPGCRQVKSVGVS
ncbi:MAG: glycosyltransferase [Candidatus Sulfotelmatobacter sp.]